MSDTMQSLDQLASLKTAAPEAPKYVKKVDKYGRAYATGKRKDAVARVWIKPGAGKIVVNTREVEVYFARPVLRMLIQQPLVAAARAGQYDVICTVAGGGLSGQAGAVRHGISKALTYFEPDLRGVLKKGGLLTRDSRTVARNEDGRAAARPSRPRRKMQSNQCRWHLMSLDTTTLYLIATLVAAMLGAMLLYFGRQENIRALSWWGIAYILGAASVAISTLAGSMLGPMLALV